MALKTTTTTLMVLLQLGALAEPLWAFSEVPFQHRELIDINPAGDFTPPSGQNAKDTPADFFTLRNVYQFPAPVGPAGLKGPGGTIQPFTAANFPGVTGLSSSVTILQIKPCGVSPLHVHPRGVEFQLILEGNALFGFIDTQGIFRHQFLSAGDVFAIPQGLPHFSMAAGPTGFKSAAFFNSANPGTLFLHTAVLNVGLGPLRGILQVGTDIVQKLLGASTAAKQIPTVDEECVKDVSGYYKTFQEEYEKSLRNTGSPANTRSLKANFDRSDGFAADDSEDYSDSEVMEFL